MDDCCRVGQLEAAAPGDCPECSHPGRSLDRITLRALLRPEALARLDGTAFRFCPTAECRVAYFGHAEVFHREDVAVPVFQKEPAGDRMVCHCFGIGECEIREEIEASGRSTASERVAALVQAGRCACELRNPQGTCCLGNLAVVAEALSAARPKPPASAALPTP
ncbi:MAG: hypothetical protein AB7O37_10355 [Vicinamibacteria bacterium]